MRRVGVFHVDAVDARRNRSWRWIARVGRHRTAGRARVQPRLLRDPANHVGAEERQQGKCCDRAGANGDGAAKRTPIDDAIEVHVAHAAGGVVDDEPAERRPRRIDGDRARQAILQLGAVFLDVARHLAVVRQAPEGTEAAEGDPRDRDGAGNTERREQEVSNDPVGSQDDREQRRRASRRAGGGRHRAGRQPPPPHRAQQRDNLCPRRVPHAVHGPKSTPGRAVRSPALARGWRTGGQDATRSVPLRSWFGRGRVRRSGRAPWPRWRTTTGIGRRRAPRQAAAGASREMRRHGPGGPRRRRPSGSGPSRG